MIKLGFHPWLAAPASKVQIPSCMQWFCALLALALLTAPALYAAVEDPDAQFIKILTVVDQADTLKSNTNNAPARTKYQEAQRALLNFKQNHPVWNTKVVAYRLKYVGEQINALSQPPPDATDQGTSGTDTKPGSTVTTAPWGAQLKLLDAGAEPRRAMRLQVKAGDQQSLGMTMKMAMDMEMGGMPAQAVKMPAIKLDMKVTIKDVAANGDITYETMIEDASVSADAEVMPQVADAIKGSFESIKGLSGAGTISNRGLGRKSDMKLPPDANPQMRQAMEQMHDSFSTMTASFPEEAIGPGARWEVKLPLRSQGMAITQTMTYELASIKGEILTVKSTLLQHAANQKIENPSMPGLKMDLTKMTANGSGTASLNLAQIMPSKATMDSKSDIAMEMNISGQKQAMTMKMDIKLVFESR